MKEFTGKITAISAVLVAVVSLSGCATSATSADVDKHTAQALAAPGETVVFGKFRLIRNGEEAHIDNGFLSTSATLYLRQAGESGKIVGKVGEEGEFAWALEPGNYRVSSISFSNRGERVEPITNFSFSVSGDTEALYIGTVTLETSFDSGFYGLNGVVDGYSVRNDCSSDCAARLERLGLAASDASISLLVEPNPMASIN